jgi:hypothetical protein
MNAKHLLALSLIVAAPTPALASKPSGVTPGLRADAGVTPAARKRFDQKLRVALEAHVDLQDGAATEKAVTAAGFTAQTCVDSACFAKVAAATKARFIVTGEVTNADEIYRVSLTVWDAATETVKDASRDCELCATEEVEKSVGEVVGALKAEFAKPAPAPVAATTPKAAPTVETTLVTDPPGAEVKVDGKAVGQTPVKLQLTRGDHEVSLSKAGFLPETRKFTVGDRAATQEFLLQLDAKAAEAAAAVAQSESAPGAQPAPADEGGARGHRGLAIGLTVGGAVALGVGGYLINLEGQVTCTDGRGRTECPKVYNTKWPGAAAIAVGAASVGAGITLFTASPAQGSAAVIAPTAGGAQASFSTRF